jgi:VanZ family protein
MDFPTPEDESDTFPTADRTRKDPASEGGTPRDHVPRPAGRISPVSALLVTWTIFIIYGTILPFRFTLDLEQASAKAGTLAVMLRAPVSRVDLVSNVLLFLPWGFLFAGRLAGRGARPFWAILGATCGGMVLSGLVECAQLFAPGRTPSLIDLATNTVGSTLGAVVGWPLARRVWAAWSAAMARLSTDRPLAACALAVGLGLGVDGLSPFDVSLEPTDLKASVRRSRPIPFGRTVSGQSPEVDPWATAREGLTWALAGGLFALALREAGTTGPLATAAAGASAAGLALLIEVAQLAIPSRTSDMTAVLVVLLGSSVGASAVVGLPGRAARRWVGPAIAIWGIAVALAAWTPPLLAPRDRWWPHWSQVIPFWAYYRRTDLAALADLIHEVMTFLPLGALLAILHPRWSVPRSAAIGLGLGLILEVGQLMLADRTTDLTDAFSAAVGAAIGVMLCRWGGSCRVPEDPGDPAFLRNYPRTG